MRKIAAHYSLIGGELRRNIVLSVDDNRQIVGIDQVEKLDSCASVEFFPGILIPGMVNAHCHLELAYLRGAIAEGSGFAGFARAIGAVRNNFSTEERLHAASVADAEMWEQGVEAVLDIANDELVMPIKERSRIEYLTLFEVFGLTTQNIDNHKDMASRWAQSSITPHSTYSLQDGIFRSAVEANDKTISVHLLESKDEVELYHNEGSLKQWYDKMGWECDFLHYATPAERITASIASEKRVVLVHGCEATATDIERIAKHFATPATWALCPESNRYISGSKPPVELLRTKGAKIAIGTDSLASARELSMVENMRLLGDIPLTELLTWATKNGAEAMGLDAKLGTIEVGKTPGIVLLENCDLHNLRLTPESRTRRIL